MRIISSLICNCCVCVLQEVEDLRARLSETEGRCLLVYESVLLAFTLLLCDIFSNGFTIDLIYLMLNLNTACNVT
jgi:hypothetical protein